ncbi:hypothetical protein V6B08_02765 [Ferrovibrio sp. MS7]|uniref:hypothetical protein n=1 Tax=Ferrovibrio plantarum TaxID=3119164 RepID=UPI003136692A
MHHVLIPIALWALCIASPIAAYVHYESFNIWVLAFILLLLILALFGLFTTKNPLFIRVRNLRFEPERLADFYKWRADANFDNGRVVNINKFRAEHPRWEASHIRPAFAEWRDKVFSESTPVQITVTDAADINSLNIRPDINELNIQGGTSHFSAAGKKFGTILIASAGSLSLSDCFVHVLIVNRKHSLSLHNCYVGELRIHDKFGFFNMTGGGLLGLFCREGENPFESSVLFKNVYMPRNSDCGIETQSLRNIRKHLTSMNNALSAGIFHSTELALDREHEPAPSRFFSWVYEIISDYGNSTVRPLCWLLVFLSLTFMTIFIFDGVQLEKSEGLVGWWSALSGNDLEAQLLRAATYPFTSLLNPLSIFAKPVLIAKTACMAMMLTLLSFLSTTSLFFLVLAIRRRFKIE